MTSVAALESLSRKELQALAKEHGLKANKKSSVLIEELDEILRARADKSSCDSSSCSETVQTLQSPSLSAACTVAPEHASPIVLSPIRNTTSELAECLKTAQGSDAVLEVEFDQAIDDSVDSFQERSLRNLTMNIDQCGKISISSPINEDVYKHSSEAISSSCQNPVKEQTHCTAASPRLSHQIDGSAHKSSIQIKTPTKAHCSAVLVPKSNKTQRLRREALAKKKERMDLLLKTKEKKNPRPSTLQIARKSCVHDSDFKEAPFALGRTLTAAGARNPNSVAAPKKTENDAKHFFTFDVDSEISFGLGSNIVQAPRSTSKRPLHGTDCKGADNGKKRRIPDFSKIHSAQFSAQKSITVNIARDNTVIRKLEDTMTQALVNPLNKDDQENHLHLSNNASHIKKGINSSKTSEARQRSYLDASKIKREALQSKNRI